MVMFHSIKIKRAKASTFMSKRHRSADLRSAGTSGGAESKTD
jgi:hypothetical protein